MTVGVFTTGRAAETLLPAAVEPGSIHIAVAAHEFAPGDLLFAADDAGNHAQWLGRVSTRGPDSLTVTRPPSLALAPGMVLFRPRAGFLLDQGSVQLVSIAVDPGIAVEWTRDGAPHAAVLAEPATRVRLVLAGVSPRRAADFVLWLGEHAGWGLSAFTLVGADAQPVALQLSGEPLEQSARGGSRCRLALPAILLAKDAVR
ncbi:MAG: hypothetical protein BWZ08_00351 [candidate division BRC1 bacterium ADurb.BinA292]|nr:MAG: hypothetical protein BWZ08_00351 [candidate division BRC1 bacterium ADurb.BinA292]